MLEKPKSPASAVAVDDVRDAAAGAAGDGDSVFDHISESVLPRANQFPPGGPAENLSCSGPALP